LNGRNGNYYYKISTAISNKVKEHASSKLLDLKLKSIEYPRELYTANMFKASAMIWEHCSTQIKTEILNTTTNYETEINNDPI
jgi:hypothetical protein